jgi:hypothetical protein
MFLCLRIDFALDINERIYQWATARVVPTFQDAADLAREPLMVCVYCEAQELALRKQSLRTP